MLNFRDELEKIKNGQMKKPTTEERAEVFFTELLNTLFEYPKYDGKLIFHLCGSKIKLKSGENNITYIFVFSSKNASEIFNFVKDKLESEGYVLDINSENSFSINLD